MVPPLSRPPPLVVARAPGRVNLIGEHTDYNGGFVLPVAIPQQASVELRPLDGQLVQVQSENVKEQREYTLGEERAGGGWLDYVQGVTWVLRREGFGDKLGGFQLRISSEVP